MTESRYIRLLLGAAAVAVALAACQAPQPPQPPVDDEATLTVAVAGTGTGTVTSDPGGVVVASGEDAQAVVFEVDEVVVLTAVAGGGSTFMGWSGACSGLDTCTVAMSEDRAVTATFALATDPSFHTLSVTAAGSGEGTIVSSPTGIDLAAGETSDDASFVQGTSVTLNATPAGGSVFGGWFGACTGFAACTVVMNADVSVQAVFYLEGDTATTEAFIMAASDDAEEYTQDIYDLFPAGSVDLGSSDLDLTFDTASSPGTSPRGNVIVGLRFAEVDVPAGALIASATITFTRHSAGAGSVTLVFEGQAATDAGTFVYGGSTPNFDISSRPRTDASVSWFTASPWGVAAEVPSDDLSSIVQEIVLLPGWSVDGPMVFIITSPDSDADNYRRAESFETVEGQAPVLTIEYYVPPLP